MLLVAIGFFLLSMSYWPHPAQIEILLVPVLFSSFVVALFFATYSLGHLWQEHQNTDRAFHDANREFFSIFQNVLDGILIVDNHAKCLDGNPAAASILRVSRNELIGADLRSLVSDCNTFVTDWRGFLQQSGMRGRAEFVAKDGTAIFVDFTAAVNYLPGRHIFVFCDATERTRRGRALRASEERFRFLADNIHEIIWTMDAESKEVVYVNEAFAKITGYSTELLHASPTSYLELIYPQDRLWVLSKLHEVGDFGTFDEEFRYFHSSGAVRWLWVKAHPAGERGRTRRIVGTAQDITSRKEAEKQIAEHLGAMEIARAEAEALRKSTLALSQNLAMDSVLDTLLQCLSELIPFDRATVLFVENGSELMVARESTHAVRKRAGLVLGASENVFLQKILFERRAVLLSDTELEPQWTHTPLFDRTRSWMGIPLTAAGSVIGVLSVSAQAPALFTTEHFRFAKSLAISAAVAIQNARVHERAEIYATELEVRLKELRETQTALQRARGSSASSYSRE
jgi:PAS domain S-box-containing protein